MPCPVLLLTTGVLLVEDAEIQKPDAISSVTVNHWCPPWWICRIPNARPSAVVPGLLLG